MPVFDPQPRTAVLLAIGRAFDAAVFGAAFDPVVAAVSAISSSFSDSSDSRCRGPAGSAL